MDDETEGVSADILESELAESKAAVTSSNPAAAAATAATTDLPNDLEVIPVPGAPREATFILRNEDHTLGNALRCALMRNPRVAFAGYSVPHPLTREIHLRVTVAPGVEATPAGCLAEGLRDLRASTELLLNKFNAACEEFEASGGEGLLEPKTEAGEDVKPNVSGGQAGY